MSVIIDTTMSEVEAVMKYARYGANNCMIGNGWEIKELVRCKDCMHRDPEDKKCDSGHSIVWQLSRDDDWYCADAERRTDGSDRQTGGY